ncbi:MAG: AAA family ATPase [Gammaproteobacteria bacterium]|nr:AAA family ATPase [Gammaproteobacteria bacterium]MBU1655793.1 AAA family ATPase [Gammaproteobacteria bacterium]MBU1960048.1 AAA family ATPase [Gammaproteobacteria bacterium]
MKIIGVYNIKGGVGKTAAAVNLSYLSAKSGLRTLLWDLDPQGASTYYFRIKPRIKGAKKLVRGERDLDELIKATDYEGLDLMPADFSFRNLDLLLEDQKKPVGRLHKLIKPLADEYDRVYLDCPPSISLVSENVFQASTVLVVPTIPTTLSLRTLEQLTQFLAGHELGRIPVWPLLSLVDRRKRMHRGVLENPPANSFETLIPYASDVERMGEYRQPVAEFSAASPAAQAYEALWRELERRLEITE